MTREQKGVLGAIKSILQDKKGTLVSHEDVGVLVNVIDGFIGKSVEYEEWLRIKKAVESDVERLEHKVVSLKKGIKHMMMNCGMPDAGDACRAVIATGKKMLDERIRV